MSNQPKQFEFRELFNVGSGEGGSIIGPYSIGLAYTMKANREYEVSGIGTCTDTDIIIPPVVSGRRVTSIGVYAFKDCASITSIKVPESVTSIGNRAFQDCSNLTSISIPDSVVSIGGSAFIRCSNLISIALPECITAIADQTFFECRNLTRVTIPYGVTSIGKSAFYNCNNLESITVSKNVTYVGEGAFNGCFKAVPIYCEADSQPDEWAPKWNINNVPVVWSAALDFARVNEKIAVLQPKTDQSLKTEAKTIAGAINEVNEKINEIANTDSIVGTWVLNDTLTQIDKPFDGEYEEVICSGYIYLKEEDIDIPFFSICFWDSEGSLAEAIVYPNEDGSGEIAIAYNGKAIQSKKIITITEEPTDKAFIAWLKANAKRAEYQTKTDQSLETENKTIAGAINEIKKTTDDIVEDINEVKQTTGDIIDDINEVKQTTDALIGPYSKGLAYTLKDNGEYEVSGIGTCTDTDIIIPSVVDGRRVTSIGYHAFIGNDTITSITIPNSVTSIGSAAFNGCSNLISITLPFVGATAGGTDNTHFGYIFGAPSFSTNGNYIPSSLKTVVITDETVIRDSAFRNCWNIVSITIPNSVTSIGNYAFHSCSGLTSIEFPDSVTSIGRSALAECSCLTSVRIPNSLTTIKDFTFYKCNGLISVIIPTGVTHIDTNAFQDCSNMTSVMIPDSVESIGGFAFANCSNLTIYCEADSEPSGWLANWNYDNRPVVWGAALDFASVNEKFTSFEDKFTDYATTEYVDNALENAGGAQQTSVTHSELVALRDNSQLTPGMFYRITDYVCTTTQENTRAMDHGFYIIVQALSENTLSENASADKYHVPVDSTPPQIIDDVIESEELLIEGAVPIVFHEILDETWDGELLDDYKSTDKFIGYGYLEDNKGNTVPVLYKTDIAVRDEGEPDYANPDIEDPYYFVGRQEIDGVVYDKWRKISLTSDDMLWENYSRVYHVYTDVITTADYPQVDYFGAANLPAWEIKYCLDNDTTRFAWAMGQAITNLASACSNGRPLTRQPDCDRTIEDADSEYIYAWGTQEDVDDGDAAYFVYSATETVKTGDTVYNMNDGEFQTAEVTEGKGVIYYMKDEFNNECPYDFKNIQFIRMLDEEGNLDTENGEETWCYTFGGKHCDRSIPQDGLHTYNNNSIGSFYEGCNEAFSIPDNVFLGIDECMTKYNKLGNNCYGNTFGNKAQSNTLSDDCFGNTFGYYCYGNTFGDYCYSNTFGNYCDYNTFGNNCDFINIIGDSIKYIEVGAGVEGTYNNLLQITPEPNADYQQIYRKSGSKEILI